MTRVEPLQTGLALRSAARTHVRTIGIEDEVFVVDRDSGNLSEDDWLHQIEAADSPRLFCEPELFRGMLEMRTSVHEDCSKALREFKKNRSSVKAQLATGRKMILACGTHPLARWDSARMERKERYDALLDGYGLPIARALTCGMHVHLGFDANVNLAVGLNNIRPYLPFIAAVSAFSPFWCGRYTGLQSYRRAVYDALPRTGLPPPVADVEQYALLCDSFGDNRYISDSTTVWWDARINLKHRTLEVRISDSIPDVRAAQAVIVFTLICVELALSRERMEMPDALIQENRWSATKFGVASLMYFGDGFSKRPLHQCINAIISTAQAERIATESGWRSEDLRIALLAGRGDVLFDLGTCPSALRFLGIMLRITNEEICG